MVCDDILAWQAAANGMGMPMKEGILLFRPQPSPSRMRGLIRIDPDQHSDLVEAQTGIVASANGGIVQRSFNALIGVRRNHDLSRTRSRPWWLRDGG